MAFGFFKKKESADIIYMNGHIYTQDPKFPWASAVACKNGRVMAVGDFDGMEEITGEDTEVIDLNERYMFPGFIEAHGTPVLKAFEGKYLHMDPDWDLEIVLETLSAYAFDCEEEVLFGYGFNEQVLEDYPDAEEAHALLDEIEEERPMIILGISGVHCWVNTVAAEIINTAADDEAVSIITANYILNLLAPLNFEDAEKAVKDYSDDMADKGITSVFNLCSPDYFTNLYLDCLLSAIGESQEVKQRFYSSSFVNRPFNPKMILHRLDTAKTNCVELDNMVNADFMKVEVGGETDASNFSQDALNKICLEIAEKGFNIHLDAKDPESYAKAAQTFAMLREKGCKNNTLVLAAENAVEEAEEDTPFIPTWPTDYLNESVFGHVKSVSEAIDALTIGAAEILGRSKEMGSIEQGKRADFTVFEENPLDGDLKRFSRMHADMTIVDSLVVYDVEQAYTEEMCDILFSMQL